MEKGKSSGIIAPLTTSVGALSFLFFYYSLEVWVLSPIGQALDVCLLHVLAEVRAMRCQSQHSLCTNLSHAWDGKVGLKRRKTVR